MTRGGGAYAACQGAAATGTGAGAPKGPAAGPGRGVVGGAHGAGAVEAGQGIRNDTRWEVWPGMYWCLAGLPARVPLAWLLPPVSALRPPARRLGAGSREGAPLHPTFAGWPPGPRRAAIHAPLVLDRRLHRLEVLPAGGGRYRPYERFWEPLGEG